MSEELGIDPAFLAWMKANEAKKSPALPPPPVEEPKAPPQGAVAPEEPPGVESPTSPLSPQREATLPSASPLEAQEPEAPDEIQADEGNVVSLDTAEEDTSEGAVGPSEVETASIAEVVQHAAVDSIFFSRHFFPKAFRQEAAPFHPDVWALLDDPDARYVNIQIMRGGAKTTICRAYMAKRIAYGISRTILYIGASEQKTIDSIEWIKGQVERNKLYATTFGLEKDRPWTGDKAKIAHRLEGFNVWMVGIGITGSVRGLNIEDHRPDLIVVDDVISDGNSATPDQRRKIAELILGAVKESLAPRSEVPDAKMVIINTPQDFEDLSQTALTDSQFRSARFGCWTHETEDLPVEFQESAWPARWSSEELRAEKRAAIARNMLSIFAREMECKLTTVETSIFRAEWIKFFGENEDEPEPPREELWTILVIDPVPPPSDAQIAKGLKGKDFEAISVLGRWKNKFYVLETICNRGHEPNWTMATTFEMANRWGVRKIIVETVAYQKVLAWLLKEAMKKTGRYWPIEEFKDKRKKMDRISQGLSGPMSNGAVFFRRSQATLISQAIHFPGKNPTGTHDDELETIAIGVQALSQGMVIDMPDDHYKYISPDPEPIDYRRGAP